MNFTVKILCVVFFTAQYANAQDYAFKVLVNKGKTEVKSAGKWQPVKVGEKLNKTDELKVSENSYVGLVHVTGKPIEVKVAGTYKVSELAGKVTEGSSVLVKYTDFILSSNEKKGNNLAATGAVDRGSQISLHLPISENAVIFSNEIIFDWDKEKIPGPYLIVFKSLFEDELKIEKTSDSQVVVNMNDNDLKNEDNILVHVQSSGNPKISSAQYTLRKLSKADQERISSQLKQLNFGPRPSALDLLLLAGFYEENRLFIDAGTALQKAIMAEPEVPAFREAYNDFLLRNDLKKKSAK